MRKLYNNLIRAVFILFFVFGLAWQAPLHVMAASGAVADSGASVTRTSYVPGFPDVGGNPMASQSSEVAVWGILASVLTVFVLVYFRIENNKHVRVSH